MMTKLTNSPKYTQYLIIISANLTMFSVGLGIAWASPMLVKLVDKDEPPLGRPISLEDGAWIVSIGTLVGAIINFVPSLLLSSTGFRFFLIMAMLPKLVGAFIMVFGTEVWMLVLARALNGISDTFLFSAVPMYASEIASKEIRGALSTILQVMCSMGIVIMLSAGPFICYIAVNILQLVVVIVAIIPLIFLPEGPFYLYAKGVGSLSWALIAELFNNKGRVLGLPITMTCNGLSLFFVTRYFPTVTMAIGPAAMYFVFSANCVLLCIFIAIFIPETKGRSFNEIQRELGAKYTTDAEVNEISDDK